METIYLDHNATTPLLPDVASAMADSQATAYGNPSSAHSIGRRAKLALEDAREGIAELLGAKLSGRHADRLIFTSGGTEANNLAIINLGTTGVERGTIILSPMEHPSIERAARYLEQTSSGLDRKNPHVSQDGVVTVNEIAELLSAGDAGKIPRIIAISVVMGHNETGVLQPVREIVDLCRPRGIPVHTDAVQALGKLPIDFRELGVAAMTIAAHKFHGPRGIGALLVRHDVSVRPLLQGGPQQEKLRPGTEPVTLAVGMWAALRGWQAERAQRVAHLVAMRDRFESEIKAGWPQAVIHGESVARLPNTSHIAFPGLDRQAMLLALDLEGVCCSAGAACQSGASEPSPTLVAMGLGPELVNSSLRFSFGLTNSQTEAAEAARRILVVCQRMQKS